MKNKKITQLFWLLTVLVIVAADRIIKMNIIDSYAPGTKFGELPGVADFIYVQNTGAAFSILSGNTLLLSGLSVVFCAAVAVYWFIRKKRHVMLSLALVLLFAGALGNAVDRIAYRFVVDFISIKWFSFPVFNIADISIVAGAAAAIVFVLFLDKDKEEQTNAVER